LVSDKVKSQQAESEAIKKILVKLIPMIKEANDSAKEFKRKITFDCMVKNFQ
jgi:hypothetical protein